MSDFIVKLQYQNNLPNAPSGPFFKNVGLFHTLENFAEYSTSTLEKNFVWQPHFGPDLGMNLDLVDQEAMLTSDYHQQVDQSELKYLSGNIEKGRGKLKQLDAMNKPWWLRNTTYVENNLFNAINKNGDETAVKKSQELKKQKLEMIDPFSVEFIDKSFELAENVPSQIAKRGEKRKVEWILPLLPQNFRTERSFSIVRFDENPTGAKKEEGDETARKRLRENIITNIRQSTKTDRYANTGFEVSMVAPSAGEKDAAESGSTYSWVKDYRMEIQGAINEQCFVFIFQQGSPDGANAASISYFPLRSCIDMKKIGTEESQPHESLVRRREADNVEI